jgi:NADH:ubiquinone oxidoreductase subunit 3 (subunit A)
MWSRRDRKRTYSILCKILVAILFVLFDVEVIFLYPWAINFKELGWKAWSKWSYLWFSFGRFSTSSKESARMGIRNYKH